MHPFNNPIWGQTNPCDVSVDTINSAEDLAGAHFIDQEYDNLTDQEYKDCRQAQQYIARKYNRGLEQLKLKLAPNIIVVVEEEDGFCQFADQYNQWDTTPYTPVANDDMRSSDIFTLDNSLFKLTKIKHDERSKTRVVKKLFELGNKSVKSDFYIRKHQS